MITPVAFTIKSIMLGEQTRRKEKLIEVCLASPLILFPALLTYIVYKNGAKIDSRDPEFTKKFGFLV